MTAMALPHARAIDERTAWRAVEQRDGAFDGRFVFAVTSTGIYCRPSCPARRPSRANVRFFDDPAAAERAGFRACRRCRPRESQSAIEAAVERARTYLDDNADRAVRLDELAAHVSVSASHLQRAFRRIMGKSPKQYQDAGRVRQFKKRLRAGDTVSRATYEAGFGSSSRVYERSDAMLGMTPAAYRRGGAGVEITYTIADAPIGRVLVGTTERGVAAVEIGATDSAVLRALRTDFPNATLTQEDNVQRRAWVKAVLDRVRAPAASGKAPIPLDVGGTAFQHRVWKALQEIPPGERRTYAEVARAIGEPTAARAVARACATNKVAVVVPCHRVVRGDGSLSGYKWGVERKQRLLDSEARAAK